MGQSYKDMEISKVARLIHVVRGQRVMLDAALAALYGVLTASFNRQVRRNPARFPPDFMFQLSAAEYEGLICQIGISKKRRGGRRFLPFAFTEQGVAMLSSVLNSKQAVLVNVAIMRAFVDLRREITTGADLKSRMESVELAIVEHDRELSEHAAHINEAFAEIRKIGKT